MEKRNGKALLPIFVFVVLYLGLGILFEYGLRIEMGFYKIPVVVIFLIALLVACLQNRALPLNDKLAVIVDTNHSNSGKKYLEQVRIANEVLHSMRHSDDIKKMVKGFMVESYIEDGNQKVEDGVYGKSITDPCLGWEKTKEMIYTIADQL